MATLPRRKKEVVNGCFYEDEDIKLLRQMQWNCIHLKAYKDEKATRKAEAIENILNRLKKAEEKNTCLHCGSKRTAYCEECYQELIGTNAKLQLEQCTHNISNECISKSKITDFISKNKWNLLETEYHFDSTVVDADELLKFMEDK